MTTSTSRDSTTFSPEASLRLGQEVGQFSTRPHGIAVRESLARMLEGGDEVVLDFANTDVSPSFAEEAIGVLAAQLGWERFRSCIHLRNVPAATQSLLKHVIRQQLARHTRELH